MSAFEIQLRDVMIQAAHGVLPEERVCGNQYRVNICISINADGFDVQSDSLSGTISYAEVYDILVDVMSKPANLLETVAVQFADAVRARWRFILGGSIEIAKIAPPIPGMIGNAAVKYIF